MFNAENKDKQVEFFDNLPQPSKDTKGTRFNLAKVALALSYENTIILTITLILLLIACYSLGVERGKHLVQLPKSSAEPKMPTVKQGASLVSRPKQQKPTRKQPTTSYTIQVATFSKESSARQEMLRLQRKGYQPFILKRGNLSEICVGSYNQKNDAASDLQALRKSYTDCYLRNN